MSCLTVCAVTASDVRSGTRGAREALDRARGDTLLAIEAMKMETRVIAERDAMIAEVYVTPGETVGPSDLLVLLS